jgi:hypothetical protein
MRNISTAALLLLLLLKAIKFLVTDQQIYQTTVNYSYGCNHGRTVYPATLGVRVSSSRESVSPWGENEP